MDANQQGKTDELVEVTIVHSDVEANLIKDMLEAAGIHCALITQAPHSIYPFTIDGMGEIRVKVLASNLEAAREIIADATEPRIADDSEPL